MEEAKSARSSSNEGSLQYDEVNVLNQEAVGMYQVAVLEAGSASALQRWMTDNGYRYPSGMDDVTNSYVAEGWCFVAIKASVGSASGVAPAPGKRSVSPKRPTDSSFDGHVQGMAFRFQTKEPVVPMRLSVFNGADPQNVVYMLSDEPVKIKNMSEEFVKVQLTGDKLHKNLTGLLDVDASSSSLIDMFSLSQDESLKQARNPDPYMSVARDLFALDLLAHRTQSLSLPVEELEKDYLRISESLGLRGADIDSIHSTALKKARQSVVDGALDDLKEGMYLTVIDGIFPGKLLASENLRFENFTLKENKNRYDPLQPGNVNFWMD